MISPFCEPVDAVFDSASRAFVPPLRDDTRPRWRIRALTWSEHQVALAQPSAEEQLLHTVRCGLVAMPGGNGDVERFLASPNAVLFDRLYKAIVDETGGNFAGGQGDGSSSQGAS